MERRKLLAMIGGSVTVGVAGCLGDDDDDDGEDPNGDDNGADDPNGDDDENGEPDEEARFEVSFRDVPGEIVSGDDLAVGYAVENTGDLEGTQDVQFDAGEAGTDSESVTLAGGESHEGEFTLTEVTITGTLTLTLSTADDEATTSVAVVDPTADTFIATSTDGFIEIGAETEEQAREDPIGLHPEEDLDGPVIIEGQIDDEAGTWSSVSIDFPDLDVRQLLAGEEGVDELPIDLDDIDILVETPEGLGGQLDQTEGVWTVEGPLRLLGFIGVEDTDEAEPALDIEIEIEAVTGESGAMEGSYDDSEAPVRATIVDNTATVAEIEDPLVGPIINDELGLPAEPGDVWFEIGFEIEYDAEDEDDTDDEDTGNGDNGEDDGTDGEDDTGD